LFEEEVRLPGPRPSVPETGPSRAEIVSYSPDRIVVSTETGGPAYLLLSEVYYPGWKAFVDGNPVRVLRGNYLFRVVEIPGGSSRVELVFSPLSIKLGTGISIFGVFMFLNVLVYHFKKGRIRRQPKS
jgi:uncharacterized membrane protein YfhO